MDRFKITNLECPADYFVKIEAENYRWLFTGAMMAVTAYCANIYDPETLPVNPNYYREIEINVDGDTIDSLLVNFLNEVIYLMDTEKLIFYYINIIDLTMLNIIAKIKGVPKAGVECGGEIKAATYHNLVVKNENGSITATVLFDT